MPSPTHAPIGYCCPFCALGAGESFQGLYSTPGDIVYRSDSVVAFISSHWWPNNPGHVLVVPVRHFENIYTLPDEIGAQVFSVARKVALAMKQSYLCDGVSTRQHNEPAGDQDVWHYHLHIFPRYSDDNLYRAGGNNRLTTPAERLPYAERLRAALALETDSEMIE